MKINRKTEVLIVVALAVLVIGSGQIVASGYSVQVAIGSAVPGDVIEVPEGTYTEDITVGVSGITLTSKGDKEDTVINGRILVVAPDVTIKGLTITNPDGGPEDFMGVTVANGIQTEFGSDSSGLVVRNNIIKDIGTALSADTLSDGAGILLFDTSDVLIENNKIVGVRGGVEPDDYRSAKGIHVGDSRSYSSDITVKDNEISDIKNFGTTHDAHGILIYTVNTSEVSILNNMMSDIVGSAGDGISLGGLATDITIRGNTFKGMKSYRRQDLGGIAIALWGGSPRTFKIHRNNLLTEVGVANWVPEEVEATNNYWDHASGPGGEDGRTNPAGNVVGKGAKVEGRVSWNPWLPHKVGQTERPGIVNPGPPGKKGPKVKSFSVTPNPIHSSARQVTFNSRGTEVNQVRVKVYNTVGARIYDSNFQSGSMITWNLVNKSGKKVSNGLYLFTISAKAGGEIQNSGVRRLLVIN